jgi:hypothetical protein
VKLLMAHHYDLLSFPWASVGVGGIVYFFRSLYPVYSFIACLLFLTIWQLCVFAAH